MFYIIPPIGMKFSILIALAAIVHALIFRTNFHFFFQTVAFIWAGHVVRYYEPKIAKNIMLSSDKHVMSKKQEKNAAHLKYKPSATA